MLSIHRVMCTTIWTGPSSERSPGSFMWLGNVSCPFLCGGSPLQWMVSLLFEESVLSVEISPTVWWSILCIRFTYSVEGPLLCWRVPELCERSPRFVGGHLFCGEFSCSVGGFCIGRAYASPSLLYGSTNVIVLWSITCRFSAHQGCELPENDDNAHIECGSEIKLKKNSHTDLINKHCLFCALVPYILQIHII